METTKLKKFAQYARRSLIEQVSAKLKLVLAEGSAARRENAAAVRKLDEAIQSTDTERNRLVPPLVSSKKVGSFGAVDRTT